MYTQFRITVLAILALSTHVSAAPLWLHQTPGDPPLSLAVLPGAPISAGHRIVAGYDSGDVKCFEARTSGGRKALWRSKLDGSVLDVQAMPDIDADGFPEVVAATDLGIVACVSAGGPSAGKKHWSFDSTFNISQLLVMKDMNSDGACEVAFGGADHRVHLLSGKTGKEMWSRLFEGDPETPYVDCISNAGDLNGDGKDDLFVRTWGASRWAISGANGADIWSPRPSDLHLSTLATVSDVNGDGLRDFLQSGNDGNLMLCNGKDGAEIWRCGLGRPIRALAVSDTRLIECFAGTAEGRIARVTGTSPETVQIRWNADIGDVCRKLVLIGDIDKDGKRDVIAGAENGVVAAFSGADGKQLWRWQGPDVVRTLAAVGDVDADGVSEIAVALLDGTLAVLSGRPKQESSAMAPAKTAKTEKPVVRVTRPPAPGVQEVPILLYHDVPPDRILPSESVPLDNFREQMDLLVKGGYTAVSLDDIAEWMEGKRELPAKPVCITFDGQYASQGRYLAKIMRDRGLFGIAYVTTDWIGTPNHLDWHDLRRLEQSGVMLVDNHTTNHATLSLVGRDEIVRQVDGCKEAIRRHLDGKVSVHHTYPNGAVNQTVRQVMTELGYRTATAVFQQKAYRGGGLYVIPRYTVFEQTTLDTFRAIVGCDPLPYQPLPYKFVGRVGDNWRQPGYADVDAEGKLWVCDYSANNVRVFLPDGTEAPFSPITEGIKQNGETMAAAAPSGVAVTPSGEVLITIASRFGATRHSGIFRYRASDGESLPGFDLPYVPGDVDTDSRGLIYVINKIAEEWHVYTPAGVEIAGSPFIGDRTPSICRGIAVTQDSSKVYVINETTAKVTIWEGNVTETSAKYEPSGTLVDHLSSECGAVDVADDGTIYVSYYDEGMVVAFDAQKRLLGRITGGGIPSFANPRGVAFGKDGKTIWAVCRFAHVQRWEKEASD